MQCKEIIEVDVEIWKAEEDGGLEEQAKKRYLLPCTAPVLVSCHKKENDLVLLRTTQHTLGKKAWKKSPEKSPKARNKKNRHR